MNNTKVHAQRKRFADLHISISLLLIDKTIYEGAIL